MTLACRVLLSKDRLSFTMGVVCVCVEWYSVPPTHGGRLLWSWLCRLLTGSFAKSGWRILPDGIAATPVIALGIPKTKRDGTRCSRSTWMAMSSMRGYDTCALSSTEQAPRRMNLTSNPSPWVAYVCVHSHVTTPPAAVSSESRPARRLLCRAWPGSRYCSQSPSPPGPR